MSAHLDPSLAPANELVRGALAEQPTVDPGDLHRILVRQDRAAAQDVAGDPVVVLIEDEAQRAHRLDDLDAQWTDAIEIQVRPQPAGEP